MKIGIVALDNKIGNDGGVSVFTFALAEALAEYDQKNIFVILVTEPERESWTGREWPENFYIYSIKGLERQKTIIPRVYRLFRRVSRSPKSFFYYDSQIARQVNELNLNLLHYPRTVIQPLSKNTPCVLTFFDLQHKYYPQFFNGQQLRSRERIYKASVEAVDHIIAPSDYTLKSLIDKYYIAREKITTIPVGLSQKFVRASIDEIHLIREKYGLPEKFIFYPANPWPHKNHRRLLRALKIFESRHGNTPKLVVIGRLSNENNSIESIESEINLKNCVLDLGFIPPIDLPTLYSAATFMIFPSLFEGFGIPLIEAMACGCPIAASKTTSIPEVVGDSALLFNPFDEEEIADSIFTMYQNKQLCDYYTQKGLRRVEDYRWKHIVPQIIQVYESVNNKYKL